MKTESESVGVDLDASHLDEFDLDLCWGELDPYGMVDLYLPTGREIPGETCNTNNPTCPNTCHATCPDTCPRTCEQTCRQTCEETCGPTCQDTCVTCHCPTDLAHEICATDRHCQEP